MTKQGTCGWRVGSNQRANESPRRDASRSEAPYYDAEAFNIACLDLACGFSFLGGREEAAAWLQRVRDRGLGCRDVWRTTGMRYGRVTGKQSTTISAIDGGGGVRRCGVPLRQCEIPLFSGICRRIRL